MLFGVSLFYGDRRTIPISRRVPDSRLGNSGLTVVAAFPLPRDLKSEKFSRTRWVNRMCSNSDWCTCMVVKRTLAEYLSRGERHVENEIEILCYLAEKKPHWNLLVLIYHVFAFDEFGISPYGYPLSPAEAKINWGATLLDVLDALKWLHGNGATHRDARWDNPTWDKDHAVPTDPGPATQTTLENYTPAVEWVTYDRGYICCPEDPAGEPHLPCAPSAAHDCYAFV